MFKALNKPYYAKHMCTPSVSKSPAAGVRLGRRECFTGKDPGGRVMDCHLR